MAHPSLYREATTNTLVILLLLSLGLIGTGLYLTDYYFGAVYPSGLQGASLCDMNSFFNCDTTTHSPVSNILGVPISLFGFLIGVFTLAGFLFASSRYEGTLYGILGANLIGCLFLFVYSILALGTLCPFCTLYYVLSSAVFYLFHKKASSREFDPKIFAGLALTALTVFGSAYAFVESKESNEDKIKDSLLAQFKALPVLGIPEKESPYRISSPIDGKAPITIVKFSDFECPACKALSGHLGKIAERYKGKVDIQYFFYPLDPACNPNMNAPLHRNACSASYLAYCLPEKFKEIEQLIFENQEGLSLKWIRETAEKEGVLPCFTAPETKEAVTQIIKAATPFNVKSTPTILLNGKKIEGVLPLGQLMILLDGILDGP